MRAYLNLLSGVLKCGEVTRNRTGVATRSLFGAHLRVELGAGFPLLTTKRVHFKSVAEELFWILRGETNVRSLQARGVSIWDEWADADGDLGPVYGKQWRSFGYDERRAPWLLGGTDQIAGVLNLLKAEPDTRRAVVTAWDPRDVGACRLPPCHYAFQFRRAGGRLHCTVTMRSCDIFLGLPFNIASYALLTHLFAAHLGDAVGSLAFSFGDLHLYENHVDAACTQLSREPRRLPTLSVRKVLALDAYTVEDVVLAAYEPHPKIAAPVAV